MPEFRCNDEECQGYSIKELIPKVKFIWNETTNRLESERAACPICGQQRDVVKEAGPIGIPWFKPENAKNHNNKTVKKYDYDHEAANSNTASLSGKGV